LRCASREPDNAATQNNFGVALLRAGQIAEARRFLEKAYESDKKAGIDQAQKLRAYLNLRLVEQQSGQAISKSEEIRGTGPAAPSQHNILFMDIVGFSRPEWYATIQVQKITFLVETVQKILSELGYDAKKVPMLHTGDGMALFLDRIEATIELAIKLTEYLDANGSGDDKLELRIGIHNGYSFQVKDLHGGENRCGPAINTARRVLDLGEARHILCTSEFKKLLLELYGPKYGCMIHDCGPYIVKHGEEIDLYNIYDDHVGKQECPRKEH
jgi:class 3 adenylate cyclase